MLKLQFSLWHCLRVNNFSPHIDIVHISQSIIICALFFSLIFACISAISLPFSSGVKDLNFFEKGAEGGKVGFEQL